MFLSGWSSILSIVCFLLVSGVLSEEFKSLCVSKWHINQLRKSIMYFLLYATLNLLQDLHSGLELNAFCIWHHIFIFFSLSISLLKTCVLQSERRLDSQRCLKTHLVIAIDLPRCFVDLVYLNASVYLSWAAVLALQSIRVLNVCRHTAEPALLLITHRDITNAFWVSYINHQWPVIHAFVLFDTIGESECEHVVMQHILECPSSSRGECFILGFINERKTSHLAWMNSPDCSVVSDVTGPNVSDTGSFHTTSCCCILFKSHLTASRRSGIKMRPGVGVSKQQETVCTVSRACLWVHVVSNSRRCSELLKQKL